MSSWMIEPLNKTHERADFSCGHSSLDDFLKKYSGQYAKRRLGTTYVAVEPTRSPVLGYYTVAPSHLDFTIAPPELLKGIPRHPIPTILLARLAVTRSMHGQGLGRFHLLDAFRRCMAVVRQIAFRAIEVEAIDQAAASFYLKYGFVPLPANLHHLVIAAETVEVALGE